MSLAIKDNPKKRPFSDDIYQRETYNNHLWHTPPQGILADVDTRPGLYEHRVHTREGTSLYGLYRPGLGRAIDLRGNIDISDDKQLNVSVLENTPDGRRVHFTPQPGWRPTSPMDTRQEGEMPKPSLRNRMKTYEQLPDDYEPDSPFRWDTSEWIEREERMERLPIAVPIAGQAPPPAPMNLLLSQQQRIPAIASPSARRLSWNREAQSWNRNYQQSFKPSASYRSAALNRKTLRYQSLKSFTPAALDQTDSIPLSVAARPKLTPTRRLASPPPQLTPPKPSSPEVLYTQNTSPKAPYTQHTSPPGASSQEALYPSLSASYYDAPAETPHSLEAQRSEEPRQIFGMAVVTTVANYLTGLVTNCWNYVRGKPQPQQIVAVETDTTGRKRRAVAGENMTHRASAPPQAGNVETMPGHFPEPSLFGETKTKISPTQNSTPPNSRPGSSDVEIVQQPIGTKSHPRQQPSPPERSRSQTEATEQRRSTIQAPQRRYTIDTEEYKPPPEKPSALRDFASRKYRLPKHLISPEQSREKDIEVENLVTRARKVALVSEEERVFRQSYRTRAQKLDDARLAKEREARAKNDAERAAEKLAKQAAEEEERRIAKEAEEEKQRIAREAEEEAARALKAQFIRPLSQEWADKIRKAMNGPDPSYEIAKTPGTATSLSRSDFAKLLPQKDASGEGLRPKTSDGPGKKKSAPSGWLNDEIVNGWTECIAEALNDQAGFKKGPNTAPEIAAFNCAWLTTLKNKNFDMKSITGWGRRLGIKGKTQNTKEYKILKTKKIFFPINSGAHWMLMIIDVPNREIQFLDSLGGKSAQYFKLARQWLEMELAEAYIPDEWTESNIKSQQQMNFDDCGVFTCINALASATGVGFADFGVTRGMEDARRMMGAVLLNGGFTGEWEL